MCVIIGLGAAIAQIAAMDLRLNTDQYGAYSIGAINVITFGSPRWAREALVDVYESTVDSNWRIVNEDDIVPTVPYEWQGYYHSGTYFCLILYVYLYIIIQSLL